MGKDGERERKNERPRLGVDRDDTSTVWDCCSENLFYFVFTSNF